MTPRAAAAPETDERAATSAVEHASQLAGSRPLVVMPSMPSLNTEDTFQIVRPPLTLDYRRSSPVETSRTGTPGVLKMAFNGLIYADLVALT
jgi:hypothetical protein